MTKRVLITGGAGFIGSRLARELVRRDFSVRILDPLSSQIHGVVPRGLDWLDDKRIEFLRGSVTERSDVEMALEDVTHIAHLAAETGTAQSMYRVARYNSVNSQGTAVLLDALEGARGRGVEQVILSSSRAIYGEGAYVCDTCDGGKARIFPNARAVDQLNCHRWDPECLRCHKPLRAVPTLETDPVNPISIYGATKCAQEDMVRIGCRALGIGYAILRLQNVYGEGQSLENPYTGILSIFSTRVRQGSELLAFEDGRESRDFVHIDDVVEAMIRCVTSVRSIDQVVNVGTGVATTIAEVAVKLSESLGASPSVRITGQYRVGDIRHNFADITRLASTLGYVPRVTLEAGLRRFAKWVMKQPLPSDRLDTANEELRARKLMN